MTDKEYFTGLVRLHCEWEEFLADLWHSLADIMTQIGQIGVRSQRLARWQARAEAESAWREALAEWYRNAL